MPEATVGHRHVDVTALDLVHRDTLIAGELPRQVHAPPVGHVRREDAEGEDVGGEGGLLGRSAVGAITWYVDYNLINKSYIDKLLNGNHSFPASQSSAPLCICSNISFNIHKYNQ